MNNNWDSVLYSDFLNGVWELVKHAYQSSTKLPSLEYLQKLQLKNRITAREVLAILLLAVGLTWLRALLTKFIFKPIGSYYHLKKTNQEKLPESAWKFLFYLLAWCLEFYVVVIKYRVFQKPYSVWDSWKIDELVDMDMNILFIVQLSFYVHSIHTVAFHDVWRKDSLLLVFHHILTIFLLGISHAYSYHKLGALTLFLHDLCDVELEFGKLNVYFKHRQNKVFQVHEILSILSFLSFTLTWFVMRMYYHPLKVVHGFGVIPFRRSIIDGIPFFDVLNLMSITLFIFNTYWALNIVNLFTRRPLGLIVRPVGFDEQYRWEHPILSPLPLG